MLVAAAMIACGLGSIETASCAELLAEGDLTIRLDTTVQFTALRRLSAPQARLLADPNGDDADRNFASGPASNRTDIFSELDIDYGTAGLRLSGAGWYDPVYFRTNANDSPATFNPFTVPHNRFTQATQGLDGLDAELLDAFVHDTFNLDDKQVGVRIGRHTLIWGESLFFGANGIAVGQAPIDFIKATSVPNTRARELFLPVNQISGSIQLRPGLSVEAYYQLEWRHDRIPGVGSYFSPIDFFDAGGERLITAPGRYLYRAPDDQPGAAGQFGAALHVTIGNADLGVYALRYNARSPAVTVGPCIGPCEFSNQVGSYRLVYPSGIGVFGASASTFLGNDNLAGEVSLRHGALLLPRTELSFGEVPRGDTAHGQVSIIAERPANALWDRVTLEAELAGNALIDVTAGARGRDPATTRAAAAVEGQLTFDYFHVLPALDLSPFVALTYGLWGRSSVDAEMVVGTGDITLGVQATYRSVWHVEVRITDYIGSAGRQPLADRNFFAFNVRRSF